MVATSGLSYCCLGVYLWSADSAASPAPTLAGGHVPGAPPVADERGRKTPQCMFSYTPIIRQRFSNSFCPVVTKSLRPYVSMSAITWLSNGQTNRGHLLYSRTA